MNTFLKLFFFLLFVFSITNFYGCNNQNDHKPYLSNKKMALTSKAAHPKKFDKVKHLKKTFYKYKRKKYYKRGYRLTDASKKKWNDYINLMKKKMKELKEKHNGDRRKIKKEMILFKNNHRLNFHFKYIKAN